MFGGLLDSGNQRKEDSRSRVSFQGFEFGMSGIERKACILPLRLPRSDNYLKNARISAGGQLLLRGANAEELIP